MAVAASGMRMERRPLSWKARTAMIMLVTLKGSTMSAPADVQHCLKASLPTVRRVADPVASNVTLVSSAADRKAPPSMDVTESGMLIDWIPLPWKDLGPIFIVETVEGNEMLAGDEEEQHDRNASASMVSRVADPDE